jgi:hypothetical protein
MNDPTRAHLPSINRILLNQGIRERISEHFHIKLETEGFMPLSIEWIGTGPRDFPLISVMHFYTQNGDLMRDPDIEFEARWIEIKNRWWFYPTHFRQDGLPNRLGGDQRLVWKNPDTNKLVCAPRRLHGVKSFCHQWSINLKEQGFVEASETVALPAFLTENN